MLSNLHWGDILLHIVNMILLFVILRFLVYKPMRRFMQARSERIAAALEEAERAKADAEALQAGFEQKIAEAEEEARARAREITGAANESARAMTESAKAQASGILDKARAAALEEHDRAMEDMRGEVIDLAAAMAEQILRQNAEGGNAP